MRVASMVPDAQYAMQQSQAALATALQQVSTGLRVNQLSDDPAASANMVSSLAASANVDQYTKNASSLQGQMQTADSALSDVVTSLNTAITAGTSGASGTVTTANKAALAIQVQGLLSSVIGAANTSYQGSYVFGGTVSTTPPFVQAATTFDSTAGSTATPLTLSTLLTPGSVTTISDAATGSSLVFRVSAPDTIQSLATAVNNAVTAGTLSAGTTATINAAGNLQIGPNSGTQGIVVSTDDAVLGSMNASTGTDVANSYAYVGNSTVNSVQVGDSLSVATNLPGNTAFTSGTNVIGSLQGLITALQSGTQSQIGTASIAVSTALNSIGDKRVPLDNSISQLTSQETYLSQETVTLTAQQTALVGVTLSTSATNLSQAELENSAVLAASAKVLPETLLNYLQG